LRRLGLDPAVAVKLIVVSHWHDDHIAGAADIVKTCTGAKFACSVALNSKEFFQLVASGSRLMTDNGGVAEFASILKTIQERRPKGSRLEGVGPEWAIANSVLWRRNEVDGSTSALIEALSPSSSTQTLAQVELADTLKAIIGGPKRAIVAQRPNALAVVLRAEAGAHRILLGSDLEECGDPQRGWSAVVSGCSRPAPTGLSGIFKVPHHGSKNGDHPGVWSNLLHDNPLCVLTPFRKSALPRPEDVQRLKSKTTQLYSTAPIRGPAPPKREAMVERVQRAMLRDHRSLAGKLGHVRVRFDVQSPPASPVAVTLFGSASSL
jgi:hypothetical protein